MDCADFRASYERWWNQGPVNNSYPPEQQQWFRHLHECHPCQERSKEQYCTFRGIDPTKHCCLEIAYSIAHPVLILHQGRNRVLDWISSWDEYRIPIPYDGYSSTLIKYCPWCGTQLPKSKQRLWYETLHSLGFADPGEDDIPNEFTTDEWWRVRNV